LKTIESSNDSSSPPLSQSSQSSSSSNKENHDQSRSASASASASSLSSKALFQSPISNQKNSRLKSRGRTKPSFLATPEKSPSDASMVNSSIINENGQISVHPYLLNSLAKQLKSSEEKVSQLQNELTSIKKQKSSLLLSERKEIKLKSILQTLNDIVNEEENDNNDNRFETFIQPTTNSSSSSSHFFSPSGNTFDVSALNDLPPTEHMHRYPLGNTEEEDDENEQEQYDSFGQLISYAAHSSSAITGSTQKSNPGINFSNSKKRTYNMMTKDPTQPQYMFSSPEFKATIQLFEQRTKKPNNSSSSSSSSSAGDLQNTPSIFDRR
jgi:hypothetical protein